jgi:hypothetical protein
MPKNDPTDEAASGATETATATPRKGGRKKGKKRKHNKTAYVREAIEAKGRDASNQELLDFIRAKHRITINPSHFSNIKSNVMKEKPSKKAAASNGAAKKESARTGSATTRLSLEEIRMVKDLLKRIGPDGLREVVSLFQM